MKKAIRVPNVGIRVKKRGTDLTGSVIRHTPGGWMEINWDVGQTAPRFCDPRELEWNYNEETTADSSTATNSYD